MQWLIEAIRPNYHSIADYRKDNPQDLKQLFKLFVSFLKNADLIAGETIAIDGTKSSCYWLSKLYDNSIELTDV
jgi:transposase